MLIAKQNLASCASDCNVRRVDLRALTFSSSSDIWVTDQEKAQLISPVQIIVLDFLMLFFTVRPTLVLCTGMGEVIGQYHEHDLLARGTSGLLLSVAPDSEVVAVPVAISLLILMYCTAAKSTVLRACRGRNYRRPHCSKKRHITLTPITH